LIYEKRETANNRIHGGHQTLSILFFHTKEGVPGNFATALLTFGAGYAERCAKKPLTYQYNVFTL